MKLLGPFGVDTRVGFVGLGAMGRGMALSLLRKGYPLQVFVRNPSAAQPFVAAGATVAASLAALAGNCPLVFLSLPDGAAVEEVLFGPQGLAEGLAPGSCVVDTSTIAATSARRLGERLRERGVWFMDAPVSGGQQGALDGVLSCMAGGDPAALAACREALGSFCKSIIHVGPAGAGQTVKACNQVAVAGALLGVAEAIALAKAQGVDPALMQEVLLGGPARSFSLEKHGPRIVSGDFKPGFRARLMRKDLRLALDTAQDRGAVLPTTVLAAQLLDAACEAGRADWDWCTLALEVQRMSGMPVPVAESPA